MKTLGLECGLPKVMCKSLFISSSISLMPLISRDSLIQARGTLKWVDQGIYHYD